MLYSSLRQTFNHPKMQASSALCIYSINIHILNRGGESYTHFKVYLSHHKWPAPANPLSMYNSVGVGNLHNASIVHQALC